MRRQSLQSHSTTLHPSRLLVQQQLCCRSAGVQPRGATGAVQLTLCRRMCHLLDKCLPRAVPCIAIWRQHARASQRRVGNAQMRTGARRWMGVIFALEEPCDHPHAWSDVLPASAVASSGVMALRTCPDSVDVAFWAPARAWSSSGEIAVGSARDALSDHADLSGSLTVQIAFRSVVAQRGLERHSSSGRGTVWLCRSSCFSRCLPVPQAVSCCELETSSSSRVGLGECGILLVCRTGKYYYCSRELQVELPFRVRVCPLQWHCQCPEGKC